MEGDRMRQITICVVGRSGAGKTTAICKFIRGYFESDLSATIYDDYACNISHPTSKIPYALRIKDTAGQKEYQNIRIASYRDANAFLLCFGIDDVESLDDIRFEWWPELKRYASDIINNVPITLAAMKCDMRTERPDEKLITTQQGAALAKEIGAHYIECSAKDEAMAVQNAFYKVISLVENPVSPKEKRIRSRFHMKVDVANEAKSCKCAIL